MKSPLGGRISEGVLPFWGVGRGIYVPDSSIRDLSEKSSAAQKIYDSLGNLRLPPGAPSATGCSRPISPSPRPAWTKLSAPPNPSPSTV